MNITPAINDIINRLLTNWSETERTVELPFLFRELPEPLPGYLTRILDIGACESPLIMELDLLGFDAWAVDVRDYGTPYAKFIKCDAREMSKFPSNSFDIIMSISTIEHIGLVGTPYNVDASIDKVFDENGDIKVVKEMLRIVKPKGMIIITVPYGDGTDALKMWMRFYNKQRIEKLIEKTGLVIDKLEYSVFRDGHWRPSDEKECAKSFSINTGGPLVSPVTGNLCILGHKEEIGYHFD